MSREARRESYSGMYHVMARGSNGEKIFGGQKDKLTFLHLLRTAPIRKGAGLYAYCIMDDHYHLVLRARLPELSRCMQELSSRYAAYFNTQHHREGQVFCGRYQSECLEKEESFWGCLRYIHNHPHRTNGLQQIQRYPFSSAREYCQGTCDVVHGQAKELLQKRFKSRREFLEFHRIRDETFFMDSAGDLKGRRLEVIRDRLEQYLQDRQILPGEFVLRAGLRREFVAVLHEHIRLSYRVLAELVELICLEATLPGRMSSFPKSSPMV